MSFYKYISYLYILLVPLNLMAVTAHDSTRECVDSVSGFNFFFKPTQESKCDLPIMPELNKFDQAVLDLCGSWGDKPKIEGFRHMLDDVKYKEYIDKIYTELDHQVFSPNADLETFKRELARLWFRRRGFTHIMCGEPRKNRLAGMHFFGRYIQAQQNGWAGRYYHPSDEVSDKIFTVGIIFKNPYSNRLIIDNRKGYDLSHADDIIIYATKAYKGLSQSINLTTNKFCLYEYNGITYSLVASKDAIVTFFSDLTPSCRAGKGECNCIKDTIS
ncbi:hypothetical protein EDL79_01015 [Ehrlichia ruminantium]|uniref:Bacterial EndoU nuclease domain-containing protein n=1 Tax=Ehrlichia ruminantium TaxID=779 RepID=A0AAE6Q8P1_EHRRU|nr:EndoU domain-containing protein [Ehrlichia ruminantium]QGR02269.1 hypothetical protein EDL81_01015 [Ehrlichia ruminantium]QGR03189.1 hypothetical protein EDL80_01015 [Ehrlichia ruminantium]QGR04114.1 hypothetical protein EDL79_01015 [Ehrlichia ruminantium]